MPININMSEQKEFHYNLDENTQDSQLTNNIPRKFKQKFIKDLNHKSNTHLKSIPYNQNSLLDAKRNDNILNISGSKKSSNQNIFQFLVDEAKIIKGEGKNQKKNGFFVIQYQNGSKFEGLFAKNLKISGKMYYKFANCTYEGSFFGQKFSGHGKLTYQGGRSIEGQWENMQFIGKAVVNYPNKDVYYGYVDEKLYKHGQGHLFFHKGCKYVGSFQHGSITGFGSYYKDDQLIKSGYWNKGLLVKEVQADERICLGLSISQIIFPKLLHLSLNKQFSFETGFQFKSKIQQLNKFNYELQNHQVYEQKSNFQNI